MDGPTGDAYDAVVVGGGHNGLACAAYLARPAARCSCSSARPRSAVRPAPTRVFPAHAAELSKYSYLVSLLPGSRSSTSSASTSRCSGGGSRRTRRSATRGILVDAADADGHAPRRSAPTPTAWEELYAPDDGGRRAGVPDADRAAARRARRSAAGVGDDARVARPVRAADRRAARAPVRRRHRARHRADRRPDRHVHPRPRPRSPTAASCTTSIGGAPATGTCPVGGMGTVVGAARRGRRPARRRAGDRRRGRRRCATDGERATVTTAGGRTIAARQVFANVAPAVLARLLGEPAPGRRPRAPRSRSTCCCRGCRACAIATSAGAGVRRHVPRQRGVRAARARPTARPRPAWCRTWRRARSTATR